MAKKRKKSTTSLKKKTIGERLLKYAGAGDDQRIRERYDALLGTGRPTDDVLASYTHLLKEGAKVAQTSLQNSIAQAGVDLQFQVSRIAIRPLSNLEFSVVDARKAATEYGKSGYDGFASVRFCPVPHPDSGADMIAMDVVALFSGNPLPRMPVRRRRRAAATDGVERSSTVTLSGKSAAKAALASMFYPPLTRLPKADPLEGEDQVFATESKVAERALVTLMCRSQLTVKKMLIGFGAGKSILDGVQGRLEYLRKERCKGSSEVVHRDLVPHFWFGELRRLELHDLSVPAIRLR